MKIRQQSNYYQSFGAKLGSRAVFYLKETPEKLETLKRQFACMGEPTTVVDIMSRETKKGKVYSLRVFNEVFVTQYSKSLLKNNKNADVVSYSAREFLPQLENITRTKVLFAQDSIFKQVVKEHCHPFPLVDYLFNIIKKAKENGKVLSPEVMNRYFR